MRHRIFIGSSKEELRVANAIQRNLVEYGHIVKVWNQGVFSPGKAPLETLIGALDKFDAAVFVFAPNDLLRIRQKQYQTVRDNVVFELGLFTGRLGRDRTFWVVPTGETDIRTASDLLGITPAEYTPPDDGDWVAALAVACHEIHESLAEAAVSRGRNQPPLASAVFLECAPMLNKVMERLAEVSVRDGDDCDKSLKSSTLGRFHVQLAAKSELTVTYGRIEDCPCEDSRTVVVLPANEFLDDACITDSASALGAFVKRRFGDAIDEFTQLIVRARRELPSVFVEREKGKYQESYGVGTSLYLPAPLLEQPVSVILTAVTRKRAGEGIKAEASYILACLNSISRIMNDEKLTDVYLPLLGSGHGDLKNDVALFCLISGISIIADIRHAHLVLFQKDADSAPLIEPAALKGILARFGPVTLPAERPPSDQRQRSANSSSPKF